MLRIVSRRSPETSPASRNVHQALCNLGRSSTRRMSGCQIRSYDTIIRQPQRFHQRQDLRTKIQTSLSTSSRGNILLCPHSCPPPSSFQTLKSRYFSNAAAATTAVDEHDDDDDSSNSNSISPLNFVSRRMLPPWLRYYYWEYHQIPTNELRSVVQVEVLRNANLSEQQIQFRDSRRVTSLWTANFTCPVTQQVFEAAPMENVDDTDLTRTSHEIKNEKEEEVPVLIDGRYYYTTKKAAITASSALCMKAKNFDINSSVRRHSTEIPETVSEDGSYISNTTSPFPNPTENPRSQMQAKYRQYRVFPTSDHFLYIKHNFVGGSSGKGGTWWTASFQCPVSLEWYGAIDLPQVPPELKMEHAGRWWYRQKTFAMHAASTNALENIDWEDLAKAVEERLELRKGRSQLVSGYCKEQKDVELKSNIQPLLYWYQQEYNMDISGDTDGASVEDYFVTTEASFPGTRTRWTASFLCPMTGERFDAGSLSDVISNRLEDCNWYQSKNAAIQAAALNAYDMIQYRKTGQNAPRFCKDDPCTMVSSMSALNGSINETEYTTNMINGGQETVQSNEKFDYEINADEQDEDTVSDVEEEEGDDDEYFIEIIPQQTSFVKGRRASALDVIAETWIESTRSAISVEESDGKIDNTNMAVKQRREAIDRAEEWLAQQNRRLSQSTSNDRTHFSNSGEMSKLTIANAILSSLAETHQHVAFEPTPVGVEDVAERILESMWSSNICTPDYNSYASYLKCIEGETPEAVATRAQEIVQAMESGSPVDGRSLPRPNSAVYASLYQVLAQTGKMDLAQSSASSESFPVTRMMFLATLSAMAHDPGSFDIDLAKQHIDRMNELYNERFDSSLKPDIEVYNAPLRWSGGGKWSRPFSRAMSWDSYADIYCKGIVPEETTSASILHSQARTMEKWLDLIESQPEVSPNIETIESIIQAWVRCGTYTGLQEAERLAEAVLKGEFPGVEPRLQTLYPVLAGWAYSGSREGPEKVATWIGRLREVFKHLETRRRFVAAPFISQLSLQKRALKQPQQLTDAASVCSNQLKGLVHDYMALPSFFVPLGVFILTSQAWGIVASAAKSMEQLDQCFEAIQEIEELFEGLVKWLDDNRTDETNSQLIHLLQQAPSLYGTQLHLLKEGTRVCRALDESVLDVTKYILVIEEKVRRSYEFQRYLESISKFESYGKYDFGDSLVFPIESLLRDPICNTWNEYMSEALANLQGAVDDTVLTPQLSDIARLCHVIGNGVEMPLTSRQQMIDLLTRLANECTGSDNAAITGILEILREAVQIQPQQDDNRLERANNVAPLDLSQKFKSEHRAMQDLPMSVQNKIKDLQHNSYIEGDLDEGMVRMLKDLPETVACQLLERFQTSIDSRAVDNKAAFLAGMLLRERCDSSSSEQVSQRSPSSRFRRRKSSRASTKRRLSSVKGSRRPQPHYSKMSEI